MIVGVDWDGTICDLPKDVDHDNAADVMLRGRPIHRMVHRLAEILRLGHDVVVITARGPHLAQVTRAQCDAWLGDLSPRVQIRHRPRLVWVYEDWIPDKERAIRDLHVELYIGDQPEDRAAALRAGARFLWHYQLEYHGLTQLRPTVTA